MRFIGRDWRDSLGRYIQRRILINIPLLVVITILSFLLLQATPGDPLNAYVPPDAALSEEQRDALRERLGLDEPLPLRYVFWLGEAAQGNLGFSARTGQPVTDVIGSRIGPTMLLMVTSIVIGVSVGIVLGILTALTRNSVLDMALSSAALFGISVPVYLAGLVGLYIFSVRLGWFPTGGYSTPGDSSFLDVLYHLVLPAGLIAVQYIASTMRYTRSSMIETISQDYVRTAQAKGLPFRPVVLRHAFRNALIPIATIIGSYVPQLLAGAVFIETIFAWPGMGRLFVESVENRDYPIVMGLTLILAMIILMANLITDVAYGLIDPRIRYD
jgi:peptide/nickel transport system permease protein